MLEQTVEQQRMIVGEDHPELRPVLGGLHRRPSFPLWDGRAKQEGNEKPRAPRRLPPRPAGARSSGRCGLLLGSGRQCHCETPGCTPAGPRLLGGCSQFSARLTEGAQALMKSRNLAARAGRWSAQHRKTAILGWILFVVLATVVGGRVGLNEIDESAQGSGESKRGDMLIEAAGFPDQSGEQVLIQGTGADAPRSPRPCATSCAASTRSRASPTSRARSTPPTGSTPCRRTVAPSS